MAERVSRLLLAEVCLDLHFLLHLFDVWFSWRFLEDRKILAWTVWEWAKISKMTEKRGAWLDVKFCLDEYTKASSKINLPFSVLG